MEGVQISYMAGTIENKEISAFSKLIYRASRGTVLCNFNPQTFNITDIDGKETTRVVFTLLFQAGTYLGERMAKICDGFLVKRF